MNILVYSLAASFAYAKTSLLIYFPSIRVRSDTSRIFRSGTDAAGLNRNKFDNGRTCVQRSTRTYFAERATTQMRRIFAKGDYCFAQATILYLFVAVGGCDAINFCRASIVEFALTDKLAFPVIFPF